MKCYTAVSLPVTGYKPTDLCATDKVRGLNEFTPSMRGGQLGDLCLGPDKLC